MVKRSTQDWQEHADALAFLGNSFLGTVRQTSDIGLQPNFWAAFPCFDDMALAQACADMKSYVENLPQTSELDPVTEVSAEYTRLFIGPPKPAAGPWETFYYGEGSDVGFGQPTHDMRELLRSSGLELQNENNQYEDHIGIELLYASVLCSRMAQAGATPESEAALKVFLESHPLSWVHKFHAAVQASTPGGYYDHLLGVTRALLAELQTY